MKVKVTLIRVCVTPPAIASLCHGNLGCNYGQCPYLRVVHVNCRVQCVLDSTLYKVVYCYHHIRPRSEESTAIPGVGVDKLLETGHLDHIKNGPIFWVDSADSHPCMGRSET